MLFAPAWHTVCMGPKVSWIHSKSAYLQLVVFSSGNRCGDFDITTPFFVAGIGDLGADEVTSTVTLKQEHESQCSLNGY